MYIGESTIWNLLPTKHAVYGVKYYLIVTGEGESWNGSNGFRAFRVYPPQKRCRRASLREPSAKVFEPLFENLTGAVDAGFHGLG